MTQQTNIAAAFLRIVNASNALNARIGTLSTLTTTDKSSVVAALNEVKASISGFAAINDAATASGTTWSSTKIQAQITAAITAILNGADSANDTLLELANRITAVAQADAGLVSAVATQSFTPTQQQQACENIGIGDPAHNYVTAISAALNPGL